MLSPTGLPGRDDQVQALQLVEVTDGAQRRTWNELMALEHPRVALRPAGAQLRYLIVSDHGCLGALGFAASALALAARAGSLRRAGGGGAHWAGCVRSR